MELKNQIILGLKKVIKDLTGQEMEINLEHPVEESHGDYASNIAMAIFKDKGLRINDKFKTPLDFAKAIAEKLNSSALTPDICKPVEAAPPGFVNFWVSQKYFISNLSKPQEFEAPLKNKKIMVEFTDPNPFKEFHIGHLYSNTIGESLCRLLESQGGDVWRVCYQGDVGLHVAKALYGIQNSEFRIQNLEGKGLDKKARFLGEAYTMGSRAYEEDENAKKEINKLNKKIYEKDPSVLEIYQKGRKWSLEKFDQIYARLGTKFKRFYFESEVGKVGIETVNKHLNDGIFEKSDGAIIFPGEKYGLHTRVFINSLGLPTYEAKDLGLAPTKYKDYPYDLSIIITAQEQSDYFKVIIKALSLIDPALGSKTKHIAHGVVRLPSGKMSSRSGNVVTGEWLIDEAKRLIGTRYPEMESETLEQVAIGAIKYALLKSSIGRDIEFSYEDSISLEGNSGPYLQYTFARTQSVLAKAIGDKQQETSHLALQGQALQAEEVSLLRMLNRFPEVVEEGGEKLAPNILCNYLFDLAQKFNLFYQKCKIIGSEQQDFRLILTKSTGQILKNGLNLLGIQAPEKM